MEIIPLQLHAITVEQDTALLVLFDMLAATPYHSAKFEYCIAWLLCLQQCWNTSKIHVDARHSLGLHFTTFTIRSRQNAYRHCH